jgi:inhibitor of KinA sporulation pathway (predicted exonuclease)
MSDKLDYIVIIDLECTCWDIPPPSDTRQEIIEIGVALVATSNWSLVEQESILIKPIDSTVSAFCTQLTTLTQGLLDDEGIPFDEACNYLREEYLTKKRTWASYGNFDRKMFQRQCLYPRWKGVTTYPFGPSHINIKNLFALKNKLPQEVGMDNALKHLQMDLIGVHHRAVDDAANVARIFRTLMI